MQADMPSESSRPQVPPPLPPGTVIASALLLGIPLLALLVVPLYARATPRLWGFPFFYWWQFLWIFIAAGCTWASYLLITRARETGRSR